jgi:hypothetical protein
MLPTGVSTLNSSINTITPIKPPAINNCRWYRRINLFHNRTYTLCIVWGHRYWVRPRAKYNALHGNKRTFLFGVSICEYFMNWLTLLGVEAIVASIEIIVKGKITEGLLKRVLAPCFFTVSFKFMLRKIIWGLLSCIMTVYVLCSFVIDFIQNHCVFCGFR